MSRRSRGKGKGDVPETGINPFARAHSPAGNGTSINTAASTPLPHPRVRKAKGKVTSKALTALQGAVARSKARTGGEDDAEFERNTTQAIAQSAAQLEDRANLLSQDPTPEQAFEFAKLLRAGVPQPDALCYVLGNVEPGIIELALPRWLRARGVVDALATLNGGRWPALEPDARLDIALDKHYAEQAHYLYTHDFESADNKVMRKLDTARESLERLRTGRLEQNSPFVKFLKSILSPKAQTLALPEAGANERPTILGMVQVEGDEAVVDAEVTETAEEA